MIALGTTQSECQTPDPAAYFADNGVTAVLLPSQSWLGLEES